MVKKTVHLRWDELEAKTEAGGPPGDDDVSITTDSRRLDSREAALEFFAEIEAEGEATQSAAGDRQD